MKIDKKLVGTCIVILGIIAVTIVACRLNAHDCDLLDCFEKHIEAEIDNIVLTNNIDDDILSPIERKYRETIENL